MLHYSNYVVKQLSRPVRQLKNPTSNGERLL